MKYYIQLESLEKKYRLQKDRTWKHAASKEILENDYLTTNSQELLDIQKIDSTITLEGKKYKLNPTSLKFPDIDGNDLDYSIYVSRSIKPKLPSKEQLISAICHGNDNVNNSVILNTDGNFETLPFDKIDLALKYPVIVARNTTFISGNDYIGKEASEDERLIDDIFNPSLECWLIHLETGKTNFFADEMMRSRKTNEILEEINNFNL